MNTTNLVVTVNPTEDVSGFSANLNCGTAPIQHNDKASKVDSNQVLYSLDSASKKLHLAFFEVTPPCVVGPECETTFRTVGDMATAVRRGSAITRAMYPIAPTAPSFIGETKPGWTSVGGGGKRQKLLNRLGVVCKLPPPSDTPSNQNKCYQQAAEMEDLMQLRAAGQAVDASISARYIGVVSSLNPGQELPGYYHYLDATFPTGDEADTQGTTYGTIPQASLVVENNPMSVAHEVVHSLGVTYSSAPGIDPVHQDPSIRASGIWADFMNDLKLDSAAPIGINPSMGLFDASDVPLSSFMVAAYGASWPIQDHWMDSATYQKLDGLLKNNRRGQIFTEAIEGDQWLLSGLISMDGSFVPSDLYGNSSAGATVGQASHYAQLQVSDSTGAILQTATVPFDYKIEAFGTNGHYLDSEVAAISTGIPASGTALKITAWTDVGRGKGKLTEFFPVIEMLRTGINNIPDGAFNTASSTIVSQASEILDNAEGALKIGDLAAASRLLSSHLQPLLLSSINGSFTKSSPLDLSLADIGNLVDRSASQLNQQATSSLTRENGQLRVVAQALKYGSGSRATFKIFPLTKPMNEGDEFFLSASLDSLRQKVIQNPDASWSLVTSPLEVGNRNVSFFLFLQNREIAHKYNEAILESKREIFQLQQKLDQETDPDAISHLQGQIAEKEQQIVVFSQKLDANRTSIGSSINFDLGVN